LKFSEWIKNNGQILLTFILALLLWHFGVILFGVKEFILPTPIAAI